LFSYFKKETIQGNADLMGSTIFNNLHLYEKIKMFDCYIYIFLFSFFFIMYYFISSLCFLSFSFIE